MNKIIFFFIFLFSIAGVLSFGINDPNLPHLSAPKIENASSGGGGGGGNFTLPENASFYNLTVTNQLVTNNFNLLDFQTSFGNSRTAASTYLSWQGFIVCSNSSACFTAVHDGYIDNLEVMMAQFATGTCTWETSLQKNGIEQSQFNMTFDFNSLVSPNEDVQILNFTKGAVTFNSGDVFRMHTYEYNGTCQVGVSAQLGGIYNYL